MSNAPGGASGGPPTGSSHRSKYKNAGLDSQEMRRRREEEGIQLRKQKREQQLFKRRNVQDTTDEQVIQVCKKNHKSIFFLASTTCMSHFEPKTKLEFEKQPAIPQFFDNKIIIVCIYFFSRMTLFQVLVWKSQKQSLVKL